MLQEPDVEDPSMGQSTAIREILNDKVKYCNYYNFVRNARKMFFTRINEWIHENYARSIYVINKYQISFIALYRKMDFS